MNNTFYKLLVIISIWLLIISIAFDVKKERLLEARIRDLENRPTIGSIAFNTEWGEYRVGIYDINGNLIGQTKAVTKDKK